MIEQVQPVLGRTLRTVRTECDLALQDVADATGVSASFLSLVEKGKSYGISITELVPKSDAAEPHLVRSGETTHLRSPAGANAADTEPLELICVDTPTPLYR